MEIRSPAATTISTRSWYFFNSSGCVGKTATSRTLIKRYLEARPLASIDFILDKFEDALLDAARIAFAEVLFFARTEGRDPCSARYIDWTAGTIGLHILLRFLFAAQHDGASIVKAWGHGAGKHPPHCLWVSATAREEVSKLQLASASAKHLAKSRHFLLPVKGVCRWS